MKTYNLFLDDVRNPKDCCQYMPDAKFYFNSEFVIVRNYDEFVNFIRKNGLPNIISFDHDLADEHYSSDMHASTEVYNKQEVKISLCIWITIENFKSKRSITDITKNNQWVIL